MDKFITTITEPEIEEQRKRLYDAWEKACSGKRGQPPMIDRFAIVVVIVDYLERNGIPFETTHQSAMNKAVRDWLNEKMAVSTDERKSRRKQLSPDAVQDLLNKIDEMRVLSKKIT